MSAHATAPPHAPSSASSSIRRASEDSRFRAFLSAHFDAQAHVTTVIQEGKSEEVFADISTCIDEVDEEIKNYISLHKHDLMAGMQDVAVLSRRYQSLQATSHRLLLAVDKTKRESFASHALVRTRTLELERIHHTAVLLRQLRQFTHAKAQLDHYSAATATLQQNQKQKQQELSAGSSGSGDLDLRQFATIAKTVQELEQLLLSPQLVALQQVAGQVDRIRAFGAQLRELAKEKLLAALRAQDQATVADCLQVFFNLHSLPQVVLMAIDATVKDTTELSAAALNLQLVLEGGAAGSGGAGAGKTPSSSSASSKLKGKGGGGGGGEALLSNASQLRVAMREMCHSWAVMLQEQAVQVLVLQRVVSKKEDPATHQAFSAVLMGLEQQKGAGASAATGSQTAAVDHSSINNNNNTEDEERQSLAFPFPFCGGSSAHNRSAQPFSLLEIFWQRLAVSLQDVLSAKTKQHPVAAPRIYPNLRRAAVEVYVALRGLAAGDLMLMRGHGEGGDACMYGGAHAYAQDCNYSDCSDEEERGDYGEEEDKDGDLYGFGRGGGRGGRPVSLFGSSSSSVATASSSGGLVVTPATYGSLRSKHKAAALATARQRERGGSSSPRASSVSSSSSNSGSAAKSQSHSSSAHSSSAETGGLLPSLSPLRDRYLLAALSRMQAPVLQMFPEVEGYTAAVPSKRDLQALLGAVQEEVAHAVLEGDRSLVRIVSREALKAVRLLLTKVEGMVSNGPESTRVHLSKSGKCVKTNQQEHNCQLLQLLFQLTDFIHKLPSQIIKATKDSPSFALSRLLSGADSSGSGRGGGGAGEEDEGGRGSGGSGEAVLREEMKHFVSESCRCAQELAGRQLLHPLVEALTLHFRLLLLELLQEGCSVSVSASASSAGGGGCSRTVSTLLEQFPAAVDTYLLSASSSSSSSSSLSKAVQPVALAVRELSARLLLTYTSVAALRRPVTEQSRLLTAAEISAVDLMVTGLLEGGEPGPVPGPVPVLPSSSSSSSSSSPPHPVLAELRAFRRLLFDPIEEESRCREGEEKEKQQGEGGLVLGADLHCTPRPSLLLALPHLLALRPSTVLGYLLACGPRQLPSLPDSPPSATGTGTGTGTGTHMSGLGSASGSSSSGSSSGKKKKKASASLDPLVTHSSDASAALAGYIQTLTAPLLPSSSSSSSLAIQQQQEGSGGGEGAAELLLLGASVRQIFAHSHSPSSSSSSGGGSWKHITAAERNSVHMARQCLDVFMQRITVCDEAQKKKPLLAWYEALLSICNAFLEE